MWLRRLYAYSFEDRLAEIFVLLASAVIAAIAYWYPWYLCTYHSAPDDRYGFAIGAVFPFWFIGPGIAAWAAFRLWRAVVRRQRDISNVAFAICGGLLALVGLSPLLMYAVSILAR